jgi:hypothetical protein
MSCNSRLFFRFCITICSIETKHEELWIVHRLNIRSMRMCAMWIVLHHLQQRYSNDTRTARFFIHHSGDSVSADSFSAISCSEVAEGRVKFRHYLFLPEPPLAPPSDPHIHVVSWLFPSPLSYRARAPTHRTTNLVENSDVSSHAHSKWPTSNPKEAAQKVAPRRAPQPHRRWERPRESPPSCNGVSCFRS